MSQTKLVNCVVLNCLDPFLTKKQYLIGPSDCYIHVPFDYVKIRPNIYPIIAVNTMIFPAKYEVVGHYIKKR